MVVRMDPIDPLEKGRFQIVHHQIVCVGDIDQQCQLGEIINRSVLKADCSGQIERTDADCNDQRIADVAEPVCFI